MSEDPRAERLVSVAAQLIAARGRASVSARSFAAEAGVSPSAVNYHFGGIEQLFLTAFEHGAAESAAWLDRRRGELDALPRTPDAAAFIVERIICTWTSEARPLALLYQECLASGEANSAAASWTALWRDFWSDAAAHAGLGETEGRLMHLFFQAEGMYNLSSWAPALEAAALRELVQAFAACWLRAAPAASLGALAAAERRAGSQAYGIVSLTALKIAVAAAEVVETGLGALTHRAVAARAGVTTGAVTHHYRTAEELLAGAIRGQVVLLLDDGAADPAATPPGQPPSPIGQWFEAVAPYVLGDAPSAPTLSRRNLFLAAVRRPELAGAAAVIRFAHGGTTRLALPQYLDLPPDETDRLGAVISRLFSAIWFAAVADPDPAAMRAQLFADIASGVSQPRTHP